MVTKFFLESHTKDCCDQPTVSHGAAKPKGAWSYSVVYFPVDCCLNQVYSRSGSEPKPCSPECTGLLMTDW